MSDRCAHMHKCKSRATPLSPLTSHNVGHIQEQWGTLRLRQVAGQILEYWLQLVLIQSCQSYSQPLPPGQLLQQAVYHQHLRPLPSLDTQDNMQLYLPAQRPSPHFPSSSPFPGGYLKYSQQRLLVLELLQQFFIRF